MVQTFVATLLAISKKLGYFGIVLLMTVESSFIPFPSEIIIPPAAYLAQQGDMNIVLVILSGVAGSLLGAIINYYLALTMGRKIVYSLANSRLAKYLLISETKVHQAEAFFLRFGALSTLIGRLLPGIRQLISLPAGLARMNLKVFLLFTALGSVIWTVILAVLGWIWGANKDSLELYYNEISLALIVVCIVIIGVYLLAHRKKKRV